VSRSHNFSRQGALGKGDAAKAYGRELTLSREAFTKDSTCSWPILRAGGPFGPLDRRLASCPKSVATRDRACADGGARAAQGTARQGVSLSMTGAPTQTGPCLALQSHAVSVAGAVAVSRFLPAPLLRLNAAPRSLAPTVPRVEPRLSVALVLLRTGRGKHPRHERRRIANERADLLQIHAPPHETSNPCP